MLTARQQQAYDFIRNFIGKYGFSPTLQEIAAALGITGNVGVLRHLDVLERQGLLRRTPRNSRAIVLTESSHGGQSLPLLGVIRAGVPHLAQQERAGEVVVDPALVRSPDSFVLRVRGDSMIEAQICSGDLVVVRPQPSAENGEIVVVLIAGDATLKRFYREQGRIRLQPENRYMAPIFIDSTGGEVVIVGKVTGLMREF
ncbi:MAG: LexA family transcriptional regulator [Deltaproteobacteria bacterium HGW-Deltaproteobacteria-4]|nr:MAG: LexA family transcriptional regulator [Deltaproteobacteria bacterium HGW-Deltaproteobacteria-4]